jgi:plasmid segregation protein ParM
MELEEKEQIQPEDVVQIQLPIGLPPKHFAELYEKYEEFFRAEGNVIDLDYNGRIYHICIQ